MRDEKYKIGYIDEDEADVDKFKRFARNDFVINAFDLDMNTTLNSLFQDVLKSEVSALVIDYRLRETNIIKFNGDEVVNKVKEELHDFPLFILTSHEDDALDAVEDVNIVYEKDLMDDNKGKMLIKRIKTKIEHYYKNLKNAEKELLDLIDKKDKDGLTALEEDRLIELDDFLQHSVCKKDRIPNFLKKQEGFEKLNALINKTEELLKEIKGK
jgi:Skp family chaperone for outer membrane proteins